MYSIPIGFFIFNRLDTVKKSFQQIKQIKPKTLYIVSDAGRESIKGEKDKVNEVRSYVENEIDWDCTVKRNYATENMGCKDRMASGISWIMREEEMAIFIEDDCIPTIDFFRFAEEMLVRYQDDEEIMMVSGFKALTNYQASDSYLFSKHAMIWGWGTWRRAWDKYDIDIKTWPETKSKGLLKPRYNYIGYLKAKKDFNSVYYHKKDTWDYQWVYTIHINNGLSIVPGVNLIENIGFGRDDAAHTRSETDIDFSCYDIKFPLKHPEKIYCDTIYDDTYQHTEWGLWSTIKKIPKRIVSKNI